MECLKEKEKKTLFPFPFLILFLILRQIIFFGDDVVDVFPFLFANEDQKMWDFFNVFNPIFFFFCHFFQTFFSPQFNLIFFFFTVSSKSLSKQSFQASLFKANNESERINGKDISCFLYYSYFPFFLEMNVFY